eukprot:COSAG06_NODE_22835_length_711_cov_0.985294_1_plen_118_part_00
MATAMPSLGSDYWLRCGDDTCENDENCTRGKWRRLNEETGTTPEVLAARRAEFRCADCTGKSAQYKDNKVLCVTVRREADSGPYAPQKFRRDRQQPQPQRPQQHDASDCPFNVQNEL